MLSRSMQSLIDLRTSENVLLDKLSTVREKIRTTIQRPESLLNQLMNHRIVGREHKRRLLFYSSMLINLRGILKVALFSQHGFFFYLSHFRKL